MDRDRPTSLPSLRPALIDAEDDWWRSPLFERIVARDAAAIAGDLNQIAAGLTAELAPPAPLPPPTRADVLTALMSKRLRLKPLVADQIVSILQALLHEKSRLERQRQRARALLTFERRIHRRI